MIKLNNVTEPIPLTKNTSCQRNWLFIKIDDNKATLGRHALLNGKNNIISKNRKNGYQCLLQNSKCAKVQPFSPLKCKLLHRIVACNYWQK